MTTTLPGYVRTFVPIIVTYLAALLAHYGLSIDDASLSTLVGGAVGGAYYVAVRYLESHQAKWGWLLGAPHAPVYAKGV